jgi:hypothetical protein
MSQHIEWADTRTAPTLLAGAEARDFRDCHGVSIDDGNVGLCIGSGVILEGTRDKLGDWLIRALALVRDCDPLAMARDVLRRCDEWTEADDPNDTCDVSMAGAYLHDSATLLARLILPVNP